MHGSRSKIPGKKSRSYIYDVKFLVLLGAPYIYIYDISRIRVKLDILLTVHHGTLMNQRQRDTLSLVYIIKSQYLYLFR
jgi:hypothetical protein